MHENERQSVRYCKELESWVIAHKLGAKTALTESERHRGPQRVEATYRPTCRSSARNCRTFSLYDDLKHGPAGRDGREVQTLGAAYAPRRLVFAPRQA